MTGDRTIDGSDKSERAVVFGIVDSRVIFLPRTDALHLAGLNDALLSPTWGELRRRMEALGEEVSGGDGWWDEDEDEGGPSDDQPFDAQAAPGYADGDWPPMPETMMMQWMPEGVADILGSSAGTVLNGDFLNIDPSDAEAVAKRLRDLGFEVVRDDALISAGCRP